MTRNLNYDTIIIGAGVSGLILANEIIERTNKHVVVLEKKRKFLYEKNLCYWNKPKNEITKLFNNKWKNISIIINGEKKTLCSEDIEYLRINSKTFYHYYLKKLATLQQMNILT